MTEQSKTEQPKIEELELNRETIQELTEQEGDQVRGGLVPQTNRNCNVCTDWDTGCV